MQITVIIGTRPEAIKMCPVVQALRAQGAEVRLVLSGQHRELATDVLAEFSLSPDLDLAVMKKGQTPASLTEGLLSRFGELFDRERPRALLVHGDTTTAFSAALAAFYRGIAVGHVEAGLRTYCMTRPFPEEFNRRAISPMATWHFAPTPAAAANLVREGIPRRRVFCVGNTVVDALSRTVRADYKSPLIEGAVIYYILCFSKNFSKKFTKYYCIGTLHFLSFRL